MNKQKVAFDLGNVIIHVNINSFLSFLVENNVVSNLQIATDFVSGIQPAHDLGTYSFRQGFSNLLSHLPHYILQEIHNKWLSLAVPSILMLELIDDLINKYNYEVAILSNIGYDHAGIIRHLCPVLQKCNQYFSCEVGIIKPYKLYFQNFINKNNWELGMPFFDDRMENIISSRDFFKGYQFDLNDFKNDEEAVDFIKNILI